MCQSLLAVNILFYRGVYKVFWPSNTPSNDNLLCRGRLTKESRAKIITLITIDVHSRDVVQGLIDRRVESNLDFAWQSQLR